MKVFLRLSSLKLIQQGDSEGIKKELCGQIWEGLEFLLSQDGFYPCDACDKIVEQFRIESTQLHFLWWNLTISHPLTSSSLQFVDLYKHYREFCYDDGDMAIGEKNSRIDLRAFGYHIDRKNTGLVIFAVHVRAVRTKNSAKEQCSV